MFGILLLPKTVLFVRVPLDARPKVTMIAPDSAKFGDYYRKFGECVVKFGKRFGKAAVVVDDWPFVWEQVGRECRKLVVIVTH
jgi:hypothetical protein